MTFLNQQEYFTKAQFHIISPILYINYNCILQIHYITNDPKIRNGRPCEAWKTASHNCRVHRGQWQMQGDRGLSLAPDHTLSGTDSWSRQVPTLYAASCSQGWGPRLLEPAPGGSWDQLSRSQGARHFHVLFPHRRYLLETRTFLQTVSNKRNKTKWEIRHNN